jgi:hypothetical protein
LDSSKAFFFVGVNHPGAAPRVVCCTRHSPSGIRVRRVTKNPRPFRGAGRVLGEAINTGRAHAAPLADDQVPDQV